MSEIADTGSRWQWCAQWLQKILRIPESLRVSMMVRLILKMLATMTAARMERPEAVHVWCSTRLHWPSATLLIR